MATSVLIDSHVVKEQYGDRSRLDARIALHARFSTAAQDLHRLVFERYELEPQARVLEVGCGTGLQWNKNMERIPPEWRLVLSDTSYGMLETLDWFRGRAELMQCDIQAIAACSGAFDAVIANHMLYHVPDLACALREVRRVLKPAGVLYALTNGPTHLVEIRKLVAEVTGTDPPYPEAGFNLENGRELLAGFFPDVQREDYPSGLVVTEVEPLVAYIMSLSNIQFPPTEGIEARFRQVIQERIGRDGAVKITTAAGLFTARNRG